MSAKKLRLSVLAFAILLLAGPVAPAQTTGPAGLSEEAMADIDTLERDRGRRRKPVVTQDEARKLLEAGFTDELIRLFVRLDRLTGQQERMPITPAQARELKNSGVSLETIRLMLESEIALFAEGGRPQAGRKVITRPDGRKVIVYFSGDPNRPRKTLEQRQEEELRRAWELLEKLQIHVYPHRKR